MKIRLSVLLRIRLSELLMDEQESFARMAMIRSFRESLSLDEDEQKAMGYAEVPAPNGQTGMMIAHPEKDPNREYDIGEIMAELICTKLRTLDRERHLTEKTLPLYEAFQREIDKTAVKA